MRILVLGDSGMLGSAVKKYYAFASIETVEDRWPSEEFKRKVSEFDGDLVINCLGAIPQRTNDFSVNCDVPEFLCNHCLSTVKIINPSSDCVFEGTSDKPYEKYHPCDASSEYGKSKSFIPPSKCKNFKSIRTSVVGYDLENKELLSWFLSQDSAVKGYTNHWWNGITTYEWAKLSHRVYTDWDSFDSLIQVGTTPITKYDLLNIIKDIYSCDTEILPFSPEKKVNRSLVSDIILPSLAEQLKEFRDVMGSNGYNWYGNRQ